MGNCVHDPLCLVGHCRFFHQEHQINQAILKGLNLGHLKKMPVYLGLPGRKDMKICSLLVIGPGYGKNTTRHRLI